jgi:TrmH family RNA methyltransferase
MAALPVRIVLVETSHPGNIGAVARAMKNMGLDELVLVRPRQFPHEEATARASGADDVLAAARVTATLDEALSGCGLVLATTSRDRDQYFRVYDVREAAQRAVSEAAHQPVALLFGSERTGLTNEELQYAHALLRIPTSEVYASLNIAMAVQIIAYELRLAARDALPTKEPVEPLATQEEMERFYQHLESVLASTHFRDHTGSGHLMSRVRRLFNRAQVDQNEMRILRGILSAVQDARIAEKS